MALFHRAYPVESSIFIAVKKLYFSMWMSKSGLFLSVSNLNRVHVKNGGPDRTRTYDPRLIKAVL